MRRFIRRESDEEKVYCIVQSKQKVILISLQLINAKQHSKVFHNFAILASLNRYKLLIVEFKFALVTISNQTRPGVVTCGLRTPWLAAAVSQERDREPEPSDDLIIIIMADCYWDWRKVIGVSKTLHFSDKNGKQSSKQKTNNSLIANFISYKYKKIIYLSSFKRKSCNNEDWIYQAAIT